MGGFVIKDSIKPVIKCHAVQLPANAKLNYRGNGWVCNKGFYKTGNKCHAVQLPANAKLNYRGNGWTCMKNFKKISNTCIAMTPDEIKKQKEKEKALMQEIQRRRAMGVSGDDCDTEYKTNAEVCVEVTNLDISCRKSSYENHYRSCDVSLSYDVKTDYKGGSYLEADVNCSVEIVYKGRNRYSSQSDSDSSNESHDLYAHDSTHNTINFDFSFSSYKEVFKAKISSAECEIENIDLW